MPKLKTRLHCRNCNYVWRYTGTKTKTFCPLCGTDKGTRDRSQYHQKYLKKHPERTQGLKEWIKKPENKKRHSKEWNERLHIGVLRIISKNLHPKCINCGCDDIRLLEINHKKGGGTKEFETGKYAREFYWKIFKLERPVDDLEVLCRVCNALHYVKLKYGKLPFVVKWTGKKNI